MSEYSHHIIECILYILGTSEFFGLHMFSGCVYGCHTLSCILFQKIKLRKRRKITTLLNLEQSLNLTLKVCLWHKLLVAQRKNKRYVLQFC